jgi:membrane protein implicated in regulation of membrane protease activity
MSVAIIWIIVGVLLILTELLATSILTIFIGLAAIFVGILMQLGWIESTAAQYTVFGVVSLILLFAARGRCKRWFVGYTADSNEQPSQLKQDIGNRVTVIADFNQGAGRVILNGVQWDALSKDDLKAGDVAWVLSNDGIHLNVTKQSPQ